MSKLSKGKVYEEIAQTMYKSLKRTHPDISIDKAKAMINGIFEEKWFLKLKREQIEEVKKNILHYLEVHNFVCEDELSDFINNNLKSRL